MAGARRHDARAARHAGGAISTLTLSVDAPPAAAREEAVFAGEAGRPARAGGAVGAGARRSAGRSIS